MMKELPELQLATKTTEGKARTARVGYMPRHSDIKGDKSCRKMIVLIESEI
ncbi:uncharacterized protein PHALS_00672 [Plasmopara halstedii]|uniref:Uncharacterized protein n=1 Tax=Plasmopara halstedii TaxID=4781 RepID=A0A0P1AT05_PLAHL|nr:uncharacterized protein PHALS_00672 [Plasmopara halstedii]CEG44303.1 hypothetical protein PHALS_00672 [Plasmopara halstedii]|eukprot:XP_024580672.1 hypothetical protein PHALS_00672 [Plasmopara halstedii]